MYSKIATIISSSFLGAGLKINNKKWHVKSYMQTLVNINRNIIVIAGMQLSKGQCTELHVHVWIIMSRFAATNVTLCCVLV